MFLRSGEAAPGSSVVLEAEFFPGVESVSGVQFDLEYDSAMMSLVSIIGEAARRSGKNLRLAEIEPGKRRFLFTGLNQERIPRGSLLTLFVNLTDEAAEGIYLLKFSNIVAADSSGERTPLDNVNAYLSARGTKAGGTRLVTAGVLNAASLLPGPVAPGEILTLIGSGIGPAEPAVPDAGAASHTLEGVQVLFDGSAAPLIYASASQINVTAPDNIAEIAELRITRDGEPVAARTIEVAAAAPALFTADSSGAGGAIALNADGAVNSPESPAARGSEVSLFATGAGLLDRPDGGNPAQPVSVRIGEIEAQVVEAAAAVGFASGVIRIVCRIPDDVSPGYSVPVVLTVGTAQSQAGVTLTVQ